jgi:hypothetical protein
VARRGDGVDPEPSDLERRAVLQDLVVGGQAGSMAASAEVTDTSMPASRTASTAWM